MRSLLLPALCLSLFDSSLARFHLSTRGEIERGSEQAAGLSWLRKLLVRDTQRRQEVCYEDDYYNFVSNATSGQAFCQAFMQYPNTTVTIDYTPKSTLRKIDSTIVVTHTELVRTTPVSTVTVTSVSNPLITARQVAAATGIVAEYFSRFEHSVVAAGNPPISTDVLSSSFSSACGCHTYAGSTVTATYTDAAAVVTIDGFIRSTLTVTSTKTAAPVVVTTTVQGGRVGTSAISIPVTSVAPSTPATPEGPAFSCPQSNGTIVSQLIGAERFDYLIMCDLDFPNDDTFYAELAYNSFTECAAACSMADALFDEHFCEVAIYYAAPDVNGYNCLLKPSTTSGTRAPGVNAAILQVVAFGVDSTHQSGTATDTPTKFASSATMVTSAVSSSMSSLMGNGSSTNIPVITPPPIIPGGRAVAAISYETIINDGTTFSTGSAYSTYFTSGGEWYEASYSTWSVAWTAATTVLAISSQETEIANVNNTQTSLIDNGDAGYVTVQNTTTITYTYLPGEIIANTTETIVSSSFYHNNTFITATTTVINSVATSLSNSTNSTESGSGGGSNGAGGGIISGPLATFSTVFLTTVSPVPSGAGSTLIGSTLLPSQTALTVSSTPVMVPTSAVPSSILAAVNSSVTVQSFGTAGSTGGIISGQITATSTPASTDFGNRSGSLAPPVPTVVVQTFTSGGSTYQIISGAIPSSGVIAPPPSFASSSGNAPSSGIAVPPPVTNTFGTQGSTGFVASGSIPSFTSIVPVTGPPSIIVTSFNTAGSTGGIISGPIPSSSDTGTFTCTDSVCTGDRGFNPQFPPTSTSTTTIPPFSPIPYPPYLTSSSTTSSSLTSDNRLGSGSTTSSPPPFTQPPYVFLTTSSVSSTLTLFTSSGTLPSIPIGTSVTVINTTITASTGVLPSSVLSSSGLLPPINMTTSAPVLNMTSVLPSSPPDTTGQGNRNGSQSPPGSTGVSTGPVSLPPVSVSLPSSGLPSITASLPSSGQPPISSPPPDTTGQGNRNGSQSPPGSTGASTGPVSLPPITGSLPSSGLPPMSSPPPDTTGQDNRNGSQSPPGSTAPSTGPVSVPTITSSLASSGLPPVSSSSTPSSSSSSSTTSTPVIPFLPTTRQYFPPGFTTTTSTSSSSSMSSSMSSSASSSVPSSAASSSAASSSMASSSSTSLNPSDINPSGGDRNGHQTPPGTSGTGSSGFLTGATSGIISGPIPVSSFVPSGSLPSNSLPPLVTGTASSGLPPLSSPPIPTGTAPFSNVTTPFDNRSGSQPIPTAPSGTVPLSDVSTPSDNRSGSQPLPTPTGSVPLGTSPLPSGTVPLVTAASSSLVSTPFDNRSGSQPLPTAPSSPITLPPAVSTSCACNNCTVGTTTIFTTVTLYGCYSQCAPTQGYIPPQAFGQVPPAHMGRA